MSERFKCQTKHTLTNNILDVLDGKHFLTKKLLKFKIWQNYNVISKIGIPERRSLFQFVYTNKRMPERRSGAGSALPQHRQRLLWR